MKESSGRYLESIVSWVSRKTAYISGFLIIVMMFTIIIDVLGRYFLNRPLVGGVEFNRTLLVVIVFFGLAFTQLNAGHIRIDLLLIRVPRKVRLILDIFALLLALIIYSIITYSTIPVTIRSIIIGEYETGLISFPMWPARLLMSIGMLMFTLQVFIDLISTMSSSKKRDLLYNDNRQAKDLTPRAYE